MFITDARFAQQEIDMKDFCVKLAAKGTPHFNCTSEAVFCLTASAVRDGIINCAGGEDEGITFKIEN